MTDTLSPQFPRDDSKAISRWRLVLGRFAQDKLGGPSGANGQRMDRVLDYLYGREYAKRGVRGAGRGGQRSPTDGDRTGSLDPSALAIPEWLAEVRDLFPQETVEVVERHALDRYGMTELVTDPEVLQKLEPNYELLKAVLSFRGMMKGEALEAARRIVRQVVEDLKRKLAKDVKQNLWGRLNRQKRSLLKVASNLNIKRTIRANLKHFDSEKKRLVLEQLFFHSRVQHHTPWHIVMAVDCSGSMMDSVIHSAVMAGIFKELPAVRVSLVAFDTEIIDLSDAAADPVEVLMSVQLGGGTDIGKALSYCETILVQPHKTIVIVVTDFFEGAPADNLLAVIKRLRGAGARVLGLAALDSKAQPVYDHDTAARCVDAGAEVAALTPLRLAEWLSKILN
jgi:Mg-chelatase subunit ChlD